MVACTAEGQEREMAACTTQGKGQEMAACATEGKGKGFPVEKKEKVLYRGLEMLS